MRKVLLGIIGGAALGAVLVALVIFIESLQSVGSVGENPSSSQSQVESTVDSQEPSQSEEPSETEEPSYTEPPTEVDIPTELPTETEEPTEPEKPTESETPSESEKPSGPEEPEKPVEIPYHIKVNRAANCVTVYIKDADGNYTIPYKSMICSVGLNDGTSNNATPLGTFKISDKYVWRKLFGPVDVWGHYTTRIVGHILFHSVPYTNTGQKKDSIKTLWEGQYNMLGQPASQGCIRLSVADAKWIHDNCVAGTTVTIYDDAENPGPLGRPDAIKIPEESPYKSWDPTDPDVKNPWLYGEVVLSGITSLKDIERGTTIDWTKFFVEKSTEDVTDDVIGKDLDGLQIPVSVGSLLDINKIGKYDVTYTAIGITGKTASQTISVNVVDTIAPILEIDNRYMLNPVIKVDDGDSREDIIAKIHEILVASDLISPTGTGLDYVKEALDDSRIVIDISKLEEAMKAKTPGEYGYLAYVTDVAGNKSNVLSSATLPTLVIKYERSDEAAPTITVQKDIVTTVDLTDIADEAERISKMIQAAVDVLVEGTNFTVSDDLSAADKIAVTKVGKYEGTTIAGTYDVIVTIKAQDEAKKATSVDVTVKVTVEDNTVPGTEPESGAEEVAEQNTEESTEQLQD